MVVVVVVVVVVMMMLVMVLVAAGHRTLKVAVEILHRIAACVVRVCMCVCE